jgi:hypothetical protein
MVAGSNPARGAKQINDLYHFRQAFGADFFFWATLGATCDRASRSVKYVRALADCGGCPKPQDDKKHDAVADHPKRHSRAPCHKAVGCVPALVAMEAVTFNHGVEGSSPSALTKEIKYLARF